jgi:hypothetical protein
MSENAALMSGRVGNNGIDAMLNAVAIVAVLRTMRDGNFAGDGGVVAVAVRMTVRIGSGHDM